MNLLMKGAALAPPFSCTTKYSSDVYSPRPPDIRVRLLPTKPPVHFTTEQPGRDSLLPIFILQRPILSLPRLFCLLEAMKLQYNEQPPCRYQRHRGCVSIIFLLTLRRHSLPVKTSNILSHSAPTTLVADTACDEYIPVAFTTVLATCSVQTLLYIIFLNIGIFIYRSDICFRSLIFVTQYFL